MAINAPTASRGMPPPVYNLGRGPTAHAGVRQIQQNAPAYQNAFAGARPKGGGMMPQQGGVQPTGPYTPPIQQSFNRPRTVTPQLVQAPVPQQQPPVFVAPDSTSISAP